MSPTCPYSLSLHDALPIYVGRRTDDAARGAQRRLTVPGRQPEVGQHDPPLGADHDVLGLDVTVNDAFTVRHLESIDELQADLGDPLVGQGATQVDEFFQGGGLDQFHDDPRTIVLVDHVQDGDEAG